MIIFLKLGGSLITDKFQPNTALPSTISRIGLEISRALKANKRIQLVLGHGSGSFGHAAAEEYGIGEAIERESQWHGFQKVWSSAKNLNHIVVSELIQSGLPVISFPPSSAIITKDKKIIHWNTAPIERSIEHNLLPLIFGDVIFDEKRGGVILSTEALFQELAEKFKPDLILLAGIEEGVWDDYKKKGKILRSISPSSYQTFLPKITSANASDVTGGMESKVKIMMKLIKKYPEIQARIFSGDQPGNIYKALMGQKVGTLLISE